MVRKIEVLSLYDKLMFDRYTVQVVELPHGHSYAEGLCSCDDRSIDIPISAGSLWLWVFQDENSNLIGTAVFAADESAVRCDTIEIGEKHRGRGIGTWLYKFAAKVFRVPVVPSEIQLEGGERFWLNRSMVEPGVCAFSHQGTGQPSSDDC